MNRSLVPLAARPRISEPRMAAAPLPKRSLTPLELVFLSLPLLYVLGVAGFMWAALAPYCFFVLYDRKETRLPAASLAFVVFLGWALLSSAGLLGEGLGALMLGGYRWAVFASTLGLFLFVANQLDRAAAIRLAFIAMATVWTSLVVFGLASLFFPEFSFPTPARQFLPQSFLSNGYLSDLTRFRLSEIQFVLGETSARPAAPFAYANGWGSAYAITAPFAYVWLIARRSGVQRILGGAFFAVGTVVAIASLNRAVWVLLALSAAYGLARSENRFQKATLLLPPAVLALILALQFTPLGGLVSGRLDIAGESDRTRNNVVSQSIDAAFESPAFGYGAPIDGFGNVPVGTHGLSWFLLVSYGVVAFSLFIGWLAWQGLTSARALSAEGRAAHVTLLVALVQIPVYGMLPQLPLVGLAAALAYHCRPNKHGVLIP